MAYIEPYAKERNEMKKYIPNDETIKAMQECEQGGNSTRYNSYDEFLKEVSIPALDEAIAEFENGDVIKCGSFKEYQRKMREE